MPASFLHGFETINIDDGTVIIKTIKTAVIGIIGKAPIQNVADDYKTVNKPIIISNDRDAALYFGRPTAGYTIPQALRNIYKQGSGLCIVINVFDPEKHLTDGQPDPSKVTATDIIGGVADDGSRTGMQAFLDCFALFGYNPKILISPVFCTQKSVADEMLVIANKIRATAVLDAPLGTKFQDAISSRGASGAINFNTSDNRAMLCYPHVKVYDTESDSTALEGLSSFAAGVMAAKDISDGYWFSPSNTEIKGILGLEVNLTSSLTDSTCETNQLNEAGIVTVFNGFGTGFRLWGNRNAAFPTKSTPETFICGQRGDDVLQESIEQASLPFLDKPLNKGIINAIVESVNQFIRTKIAQGALIDGKCFFNPDYNSAAELANGHLRIDYEYIYPAPTERITYASYRNISLYKTVLKEDN